MITKLAALTGWFICVLAMTGWFILALHRHHLGGILITGTGLVLLVVVPLLARRVNPPPR